jgi:hypothetical protein
MWRGSLLGVESTISNIWRMALTLCEVRLAGLQDFSLWGRCGLSSSTSSDLDRFEKEISDVIRVEGTVIAFTVVALGFLVSAISSFNQLNIGLAQISGSKMVCEYIPLGPTFLLSGFIIIADAASLCAGLFAKVLDRADYRWRYRLLIASIVLLALGLGIFVTTVWNLRNAFFYHYPC